KDFNPDTGSINVTIDGYTTSYSYDTSVDTEERSAQASPTTSAAAAGGKLSIRAAACSASPPPPKVRTPATPFPQASAMIATRLLIAVGHPPYATPALFPGIEEPS